MGTFNQVMLLANLTRDPQNKVLPSGTNICEVGLATNRRYEVQGEKREEVMFIDATAFGKQAELIGQYFKKGSPIFVTARLKLDTWTTQDGSKRSKHTLAIDNFQFVGGRDGGDRGGQDGAGEEDQRPASERAASRSQQADPDGFPAGERPRTTPRANPGPSQRQMFNRGAAAGGAGLPDAGRGGRAVAATPSGAAPAFGDDDFDADSIPFAWTGRTARPA